MRCHYCQSEIPDELQYCPFCGEVLELPADPGDQAPEEEIKETPESILEHILVVEDSEGADRRPRPVDLDEEVDRADAPALYKQEAHEWNARVRMYERERARYLRGHGDPYYQVHINEPDSRDIQR